MLGQFDQIARYASDGLQELVTKADYTFDPLGRITDLDHSGPTGNFLAGYDLVWDILESEDAFDYNPTHRYLWGPATDQLLADDNIPTNETLWPLSDHH